MKHHFDPATRHEDLVNLVETMNCGIIGRGLDGKVAFVNSTLLEWLGYKRDELVDRPAEVVTPPELHQLIRDEMNAARSGDLRVRLSVMQRKDGTTFPVVSVPHRLFDEDGDYLGGFVILVDLGAVQTAKPAGYVPRGDVRALLNGIATQLQSISLAMEGAGGAPLPLDHPDLQDLSPRETEVLGLLVGGDRVATIAQELHISPHTVRNHLKSIYRKLEVQTQAELIKRVRGLKGGAAGDPEQD